MQKRKPIFILNVEIDASLVDQIESGLLVPVLHCFLQFK
jgi:hypothetical protein